jgi:hypothetical protein
MSSANGETKTATIGTVLRRIEIVVSDAKEPEMTIYEVLTLAKPSHDK